jgi:hypothetical protein
VAERVYFVTYEGQMTAEDRAALDRPGFELHEHGFDVFRPGQGRLSNPRRYQAVCVTAESPEDARRRLIEALGREPDHLHAFPPRSTSA